LIELKNISKTFSENGSEFHAVKDVTLTIQDGEIYGIIGFSGAGKSTLVRCINLLGRPSKGEVHVNGADMLSLSPKELREARKKIGMIFQHFNLMASRTVFDNVAFPLKKSGLSKAEIKEKVNKLLDLVEIRDKADVYPAQLSGGQKQRVAIARALANDPSVLLCDEATSALDPQTTGSILALLKKLNQELSLTIVIITHEMEVVKGICNKVAVMERGEVVESGDIFDIFSNPKQKITKDFIRTTSNLYKVEDWVKNTPEVLGLEDGDVVARLTYTRKDVSEPLISYVSRTYGIDLNIICADVEIVAGAPIGGTVVIFRGDAAKIQAAIEDLKSKHVGVEVIGNE
jgi:D-methionine transport system ATP-binding protein